MKTGRCMSVVMMFGMAACHMAAGGEAGGNAYYKGPQLFSTAPDVREALQSIDRFGPVGIGIELVQPAFKMRIKDVEKGSPAAATGKLKKGQLIDSINGKVLEAIDPRIILGRIIADAEATDGRVALKVRDGEGSEPREVVVTIPALGTYSKSWPRNCPKSDRIVRDMAEYLKRTGADGMGLGSLFLLSTGDESDLAFVRKRFQERAAKEKAMTSTTAYPWHAGYGGTALCEYVLRTGDRSIMHSIQLFVDRMESTIYNNAWGHRGVGSYSYMAGGHMNAAGVHALTFMLLAKECGADVNDKLLNEALSHFYRFAGHGNVPYGDGMPEPGFVDNGKTAGLAFTMQAAASLTPQGEGSVYAKARDISALKSFYSTSYMLHGHTGGGIGEIWRGAAIGLLADKRPNHHREFMDNRAWFYDLSRRYDGSFGIVGGGRYDDPAEWGIGLAMAYTVPRKTLRMTGAPKTEHCRTFALPARPWGTAADEAFLAIDPSPTTDGKVLDMDRETLARHSALHFFRLADAKDTPIELLDTYARHPDIGIRGKAMDVLLKRAGGDKLLELLASGDPRVRAAAAARAGQASEPVAQRLLAMIDDPGESRWVVLRALEALEGIAPERLAPHLDRLLPWLEHEEWWMRQAALKGLGNLATDSRYHARVLPPIAKMQAGNTRAALVWTFGGITGKLASADPKVIAAALAQFGEAYLNMPKGVFTASGELVANSESTLMRAAAWSLTRVPGGYDRLFEVGRKRYPNQTLPHQDLFFEGDTSKFSGELRESVGKTVLADLIPTYIGSASNRKLLIEEVNREPYKGGFYYREPRMEELVRLYQRAGVHDYDWHDFGPGPDQIQWLYHTFDPQDGKLFGGTRYRAVTYPKGMDNWFGVAFDTQQAGWKTGRAPFGQRDGKLAAGGGECQYDFCRCGKPMQTFWDKEVLLARSTLKLPELKEGHRYRLVIGGMSHVNRGEGFRIYVNGKQLMERNRGVGKREGAEPVCYWLDREWIPELQKHDVVVAVTSFLQHDFKTRKVEQHFSVWFQEMKVPPLGEDVMLQSIRVTPMKTAQWQSLQDPERPEFDPGEGLFRWDGKPGPNPQVLGAWKQLGDVAAIEDFKPGTRLQAKSRLPKSLVFQEEGRTDNALFRYIGDLLLNLDSNEALKMTVRTLGGEKYLFIEAGGFSEKSGASWKTPLVVMRREP